MNADELVAIPRWVQREVASRDIPRLYAELAAVVQNNANGSPQAFQSQKAALIEALEAVSLNSMTDSQVEFLNEKLRLSSHLGRSGVDEVEGILFRNSLDVATASAEMSRISGEVQGAIDRAAQIGSALSGLIDEREIQSDEILLRLVFDHEASIEDLVGFKKWASEWHDIGRGIAMAVGETPRDLRVVGAQNGSIILTIATTCAIARIVSSILLKALEVAEKVQQLRKMQLEIEAMKLSNQAALEALKEQEKCERSEGLRVISSATSAGLQLDGEKVTALDKSIAKLLSFIEKGGAVDLVLPEKIESDSEGVGGDNSRLVENVLRIRELERQQRLMPYNAANDDLG